MKHILKNLRSMLECLFVNFIHPTQSTCRPAYNCSHKELQSVKPLLCFDYFGCGQLLFNYLIHLTFYFCKNFQGNRTQKVECWHGNGNFI